MSAFWSAYITILSLGCLAFVAGAMYFTTHLDVHRDPDGTTGHEYDGIQEYDNPMPRGLLTVKLSLNAKALNIAIKDAEIIGDETVVLAVRKILDEAIDSNS